MRCQSSVEIAMRPTARISVTQFIDTLLPQLLSTQWFAATPGTPVGNPVAIPSSGSPPRRVSDTVRPGTRCQITKREIVKEIILAVLAFAGLSGFGGPRVLAQDPSSQPAATADNTADAITDQQLALLRKDIRSIKKQLISVNLTLTDSEATKFWPVYEQYSADMGKINDTRTVIIKEYSDGYGTLTDDQADNLIRRWLDTDISAAQLRQKYVPIFRNVLPGKKAATFFQLDRRISMMIDVQLTSQLPLVQSQE